MRMFTMLFFSFKQCNNGLFTNRFRCLLFQLILCAVVWIYYLRCVNGTFTVSFNWILYVLLSLNLSGQLKNCENSIVGVYMDIVWFYFRLKYSKLRSLGHIRCLLRRTVELQNTNAQQILIKQMRCASFHRTFHRLCVWFINTRHTTTTALILHTNIWFSSWWFALKRLGFSLDTQKKNT